MAAAAVKAITLYQPWATLMAFGFKTVETRSWATNHRGLLLIHAAAPSSLHYAAMRDAWANPVIVHTLGLLGITKGNWTGANLPMRQVLAMCHLFECTPTEIWQPPSDGMEYHFGNYGPNRYGWRTNSVLRLHQGVQAKGRQGLWTPDAATWQQVQAQIIVQAKPRG